MKESIFNQIIGNNIKAYRKEKGYKRQEDFAKAVGTSRSNIAHLESPNINQGVSLYLLYKISRVLNKNIDDFLR